MSAYQLKGKFAIVTGAGSGINHALTELLLAEGCSVVLADLRLRPEAEATLAKYPHPPSAAQQPSAVYHNTDVSDWAQLNSLWKTALKTFGRIDVVVNGAGLYEPPSSSFWYPPGISPLAEDAADAHLGVYKTFAVNTMGPIRLAQIAVDYWLQNRQVQGNLLWVASMGGYVHSAQTPFYFASKAAIVSMVKSLACMKQKFGIRSSALCPGAVFTPIFDQEYCRSRLRPDDIALTAEQCAEVALRVLREPQYGDGNIVETQLIGDTGETSVYVRDVPMELLYSTVGPLGAVKHAMAEQEKFLDEVQEKGLRL